MPNRSSSFHRLIGDGPKWGVRWPCAVHPPSMERPARAPTRRPVYENASETFSAFFRTVRTSSARSPNCLLAFLTCLVAFATSLATVFRPPPVPGIDMPRTLVGLFDMREPSTAPPMTPAAVPAIASTALLPAEALPAPFDDAFVAGERLPEDPFVPARFALPPAGFRDAVDFAREDEDFAVERERLDADFEDPFEDRPPEVERAGLEAVRLLVDGLFELRAGEDARLLAEERVLASAITPSFRSGENWVVHSQIPCVQPDATLAGRESCADCVKSPRTQKTPDNGGCSFGAFTVPRSRLQPSTTR